MTEISLNFQIQAQPDDSSCGPTCLQAVYRHYGKDFSVMQLIQDIDQLQDGGTLAVLLGIHALRMGFRATIYTFNITVFDPSWFPSSYSREFHSTQITPAIDLSSDQLIARLERQAEFKESEKLRTASQAYITFLQLGGKIQMEDISFDFLAGHLRKNQPILTGLSATYLYHAHREFGGNLEADDIRGVPQGHFVVLSGFNAPQHTVTVSDPYLPNPSGQQLYSVPYDRLVGAIYLGVLTYDANLLVIEPT